MTNDKLLENVAAISASFHGSRSRFDRLNRRIGDRIGGCAVFFQMCIRAAEAFTQKEEDLRAIEFDWFLVIDRLVDNLLAVKDVPNDEELAVWSQAAIEAAGM
jgi:hypothetical protein